MLTDQEMATIYRGTAEELERVGWVKRTAFDSRGRKCIQQAMFDVFLRHRGIPLSRCQCGCGDTAPSAWDNSELSMVLLTFMRFVGAPSVPTYNDWPSRTLAEVLTALRACADMLEAKAAVKAALREATLTPWSWYPATEPTNLDLELRRMMEDYVAAHPLAITEMIP